MVTGKERMTPESRSDLTTAPDLFVAKEEQLDEETIVDPNSMPATLQREIRGFEVIRLLGRGGMGAVYEGRNRSSGERVAIKVMHPAVAASPRAGQRFRRELKTLIELDSPRIVRVLDVGPDDALPYFVMEYLDGETLATSLERRGALGVSEALDLLLAVATGMATLHKKGIIHRDLKPANIFLANRLGPKILDLGVARDVALTALTGVAGMIGTPLYASPEALEGRSTAFSSDVYQLGLIYYEMLTARRDFRHPEAINVLRETALRGGAAGALLPQLLDLFLNSVAYSPENRYRDGQCFLEAIGRAIDAATHPSSQKSIRPGNARALASTAESSVPPSGGRIRPEWSATMRAATEPRPVETWWFARKASGVLIGLGALIIIASALLVLALLPDIIHRCGF